LARDRATLYVNRIVELGLHGRLTPIATPNYPFFYGLACDLVKDINGSPSWKGDFKFLGKLAKVYSQLERALLRGRCQNRWIYRTQLRYRAFIRVPHPKTNIDSTSGIVTLKTSAT